MKQKATPMSTGAKKSKKPKLGRVNSAEPIALHVSPKDPLAIVGIGASAGGLEALDIFFRHMPADSGVAFVVVTHMSSEQPTMLPELLQRCTAMPVSNVVNGLRPKSNNVYVITPGSTLSIENQLFKVTKVQEHLSPSGVVDQFFRSLAREFGRQGVGVILSGTGTDGTVGARALKGESGLILVQEPRTAKFDSMPLSVVDTGVADFVLPPDQLPEALVGFLNESAAAEQKQDIPEEELQAIIPQICTLIRNRTRHDFSSYKPSTIGRRLERRMHVHQLRSPTEYLEYMRQNPLETDSLFKELLIGVTEFFRDSEAFAALAERLCNYLKERKADDEIVRAWVPGCSTGEEAYSVAITLQECSEKLNRQFRTQIFATDLDPQSIQRARSGLFSDGIGSDVGPDRLKRYFVAENGRNRIRQEIRDLVTFSTHNALRDPPFMKLDLVSCRNLLIYLAPKAQAELLKALHYSLKPGGILFLGPSETIGEALDLFTPVDKKWKLFQRTNYSNAGSSRIEIQSPETTPHTVARANEPNRMAFPSETVNAVRALFLDRNLPPTIVINEKAEIIYIHDIAGRYLNPPIGSPPFNLIGMLNPGMAAAVSELIRQALIRSGGRASRKLKVAIATKPASLVVTVTKLTNPPALRGLVTVAFSNKNKTGKASRPQKGSRIRGPESRITTRQLKAEMDLLKESHQTALEELQSTNEELQSTNEELQSANEELETSKEEMQSLNEELQTVNTELQAKIEDLSTINDDMNNLLNSTDVATVFLDSDLNIRRFTQAAKQVFNLRDSDIGRPLADLVANLKYEHLSADCREVMQTLNRKEIETETFSGKGVLLRVVPYRTTENLIDGLVLTFLDIDLVKKAEQEARKAYAYTEGILQTLREPFVVLDDAQRIISANEAFCSIFGTSLDRIKTLPLYLMPNCQIDAPEFRGSLEAAFQHAGVVVGFEIRCQPPTGGATVLQFSGLRLGSYLSHEDRILLVVQKVMPIGKEPS